MLCSDCKRPMKPVVAWDIDGTLGDYHGHLLTFSENWLGTTPSPGWSLSYDGSTDLATFMDLDKATYRQIKLAYRQGGMKRTMPPFMNAAYAVQQCQEAGAEVWITTTRPYMRLDNIDPDTQEWLRRNDIHYDGLIYDEEKYKRLCDIVDPERIVGVVEDLPDLYDEAEALGLRPIQYGTRYNRAVPRPTRAATLAWAAAHLANRIQEWKDHHAH